MQTMVEFKGYALTNTNRAEWTSLEVVPFIPKKFEDDDVELAITHCGLCGSDIHIVRQGWGSPPYTPIIVGHEIVGIVTKVGPKVTEFKPGDRAGVGGRYCPGATTTVLDRHPDGSPSQGGFATAIRANERFVFAIPEAIESKDAASMLCAGLTVFSPMRRNNVGPGTKVGVVGIGDLGHYAILFAKALGAEVYAFTHSPSKRDDAKKLGADHIIDIGNETPRLKDFHKPYTDTLDFIIATTSIYSPNSSFSTYTSMLTVNGKFITVSLPDADKPMPPLHAADLVFSGAYIGGSFVGSKIDCYAMLKIATEKGIKPWVEELPMRELATALEKAHNGDARYRYVLTQDVV
ncbi:GroES-like protein [Rhodofomes roseus]|uniref:GroES-like protein n=1 Tax=Rhodofomes roseus TaxID=34475 RepID=A0ABQ8K3Q9_9APHY|nr:GroES-like protein [Rhodofomes roseus]KAH9831477.1 GroES-like protein [Rhodofomes roseus]